MNENKDKQAGERTQTGKLVLCLGADVRDPEAERIERVPLCLTTEHARSSSSIPVVVRCDNGELVDRLTLRPGDYIAGVEPEIREQLAGILGVRDTDPILVGTR